MYSIGNNYIERWNHELIVFGANGQTTIPPMNKYQLNNRIKINLLIRPYQHFVREIPHGLCMLEQLWIKPVMGISATKKTLA